MFYATERAYSDRCQLLNEKAEKINIGKEKLENCPLKKVDCSITKEIDYYKSLECHFDEIEEDAKAIAKENEDLKNQIEQMKCCENCESVFDADGFCYLYKDGKCINQSEWVKNEYNLVKKEKNNE